MLTVNIDEIQKNLISYFHQVAAGESIIIIESGKPIAEIKPVSPTSPQIRPYGLCAGEFTVPDDFNDPLPDEILNSFEGKDLVTVFDRIGKNAQTKRLTEEMLE